MIKRFFFFSLVLLICGVSCAQIARIESEQIPRTKLIAQGGYWKSSGTAPNYPEALEAAFRFGCYASECTVRETSDHVWVVVVEEPVRKRISDDISYAQLQQSEARFFTLDEFILQYPWAIDTKKSPRHKQVVNPSKSDSPTKLLLNFHPCAPVKQIDGLTALLTKILSDSKFRQLVEFCSDDLSVCMALSNRFPDIPNMYMKGNFSPRELKKKGFHGGCVYERSTLVAHPQWTQDAVALEMPVGVSGIQTADDLTGKALMGVSLVFTDNLALVNAWLQQKSTVKLMSFNIRMSGMPDVDGDNAWDNRKNAVVKMITSEDPDVFGVQEMLPDQQEFLRQELTEYEMVGVGRDDGQEQGECMGILYKKNRFELLKNGTFWLSETPEVPSMGWDAACKRTVTYVQLKDRKNGKKFFYFNTHLDHVGLIARQESVKLIAAKIRELVPDTNSVIILGGDMNTPLTQNIFIPLIGERIKSGPKEKMVMAGKQLPNSSKEGMPMESVDQRTPAMMKSARNTAWERDNMQTYNGFGKDKPSQIDHIFTSRRVENLVFRTVRDSYGVPYVSDHYPVTLVFVLK